MADFTYIFWQNILSIHQSSFIYSLSTSNKVFVIVEKDLDERRLKGGWEIPDFGTAKIIINPSIEKIYNIFEKKDCIHIFSGFDAYPLIRKSLSIAVKNKSRIGIISEPFNWIGFKGKLKLIKYYFLKIKYNHHINFILAIGNKGVWCFKKTGFYENKIFDWGYFTSTMEKNIFIKNNYTKRDILFIGSIDKRKNILHLVEICIRNKDMVNKFIIIGSGFLENKVRSMIANHTFIEFLGTIDHQYIKNYISNSELLVLPSVFDGWGAVVNESLMCGTPVLASDHCGSSILLKGNRGKVFSINKNNLEAIFKEFLKELPYNYDIRADIQSWANKNITGLVAANYFEEIINHIYNDGIRPTAPWLK